MGTYWDTFIEVYRNRLHRVTIEELLEAFFHYVKDDKVQCDRVMHKR